MKTIWKNWKFKVSLMFLFLFNLFVFSQVFYSGSYAILLFSVLFFLELIFLFSIFFEEARFLKWWGAFMGLIAFIITSVFLLNSFTVISFYETSDGYKINKSLVSPPFSKREFFLNSIDINLLTQGMTIKKVSSFDQKARFSLKYEDYEKLKDKDYDWWKNKSEFYFTKKFMEYLKLNCKEDEGNVYLCPEKKIEGRLLFFNN